MNINRLMMFVNVFIFLLKSTQIMDETVEKDIEQSSNLLLGRLLIGI